MDRQEKKVFNDVYLYGRKASYSLYEEKWHLESHIEDLKEDLNYLHDLLDGNLEQRSQYYLHLEDQDDYKDSEDWWIDFVREQEEVREMNFKHYTNDLAKEAIPDIEEWICSYQADLKKFPKNLDKHAEVIRKSVIKKIRHLLPDDFDETKAFNDIETTCCICGKSFRGLGNDPWPLKASGECCDACYAQNIAVPDFDFVYPRDYSAEEDAHFVFVMNQLMRLYGRVSFLFIRRLYYHMCLAWKDRIIKTRQLQKNLSDNSRPFSTIVEQISEILDSFSEKEQDILILRFGLDGEKIHTIAEVCEKFNITREKVRQVEAKAMRKIRFRNVIM